MMKSEEILISGRILRRRRIFDLYSSAVWPRFIAASMRSEPLCTGRCRWSTSCGYRVGVDQCVGKLHRVRGGVADALDTGNLPHSAAIRQSRRSRLVTVAAVGVDVLAQQVDFCRPLSPPGERPRRSHRPPGATPPRHGYRAPRRRCSTCEQPSMMEQRRGPVDLWARAGGRTFSISGKLTIHSWCPRAALLHHLRQAMQGLWAEYQVHIGCALTDLRTFLAGHAAAHADHQVGILLFQVLPATQLVEHLLLGFFPYRTGI